MIGPPGSGKSMLAQRFAGLLPPMTRDEALESAARRQPGRPLRDRSLVRAADCAARTIRPAPWRWWAAARRRGRAKFRWRITACCFSTNCRSSRAPRWRRCASRWRPGTITIARAARRAEFPARFQLIAAMNPCPCGYLGSTLQGLPLHARPGGALPGQAQRPAARPHRHAHRSARGVGGTVAGRPRRRSDRLDPRTRRRSARSGDGAPGQDQPCLAGCGDRPARLAGARRAEVHAHRSGRWDGRREHPSGAEGGAHDRRPGRRRRGRGGARRRGRAIPAGALAD